MSEKKPFILITNDDGIYAKGIKHLWNAIHDLADIAIVAPASEKSGVGASLTLHHPLHINEVEWDKNTAAWKVSGTPADCVRLACSVLLKRKPDLLVSGINRGSNAGRTVFHSGTVGGAIEGAMRNIPSVAFSCVDFDDPQYQPTEEHVRILVQHLLKNPLPVGTLLNMNFPSSSHAMQGIRLARQGRGYWIETPDQRKHPSGHDYYWLGGTWGHHDEHEESDVSLLDLGYTAVVPINVHELTDHHFYQNRKQHFDTLA